MPDEVMVYTSAFWDSDCCGARFERICRKGQPDIYVCTQCDDVCRPVPSPQVRP